MPVPAIVGMVGEGMTEAVACTNFIPVSVTNNTSLQNLMSCAGRIPPARKHAEDRGHWAELDRHRNQAHQFSFTVGGGTVCNVVPAAITAGVTVQLWNAIGSLFVVTSGVLATPIGIAVISETSQDGTSNSNSSINLVSINATLSNVVQIQALANTSGRTITENG